MQGCINGECESTRQSKNIYSKTKSAPDSSRTELRSQSIRVIWIDRKNY